MSLVYLDTSALVKHYVAEIGSEWVNALLTDSDTAAVFSSHLALLEATCAFARRVREGNLSTDLHAALLRALDYDCSYRYIMVDVVPATIDVARALANQYALRAYDAVHLATAWLINQELGRAGKPPLLFVAADELLLGVARAENMPVQNPSDHAQSPSG